MIDEFLSFVESKNIAIKENKTLLAVSGGIDSVVLVYLFHQLELNFGIAHCNFSLRGDESDKDEIFVKELADRLNVEFYTKKFNAAKVAESKGVSIQMAARELRYNWFEQIRAEFGYRFTTTAHHRGDTVETVLFNLSKGTGISGLHGIKVKMDNLIRPLLFASRKEIKIFAESNNILWREDSSNSSIKYSRNKIRHKVIPLLEEINPKAQDAIYATSKRVEEVELFLKPHIESVINNIVKQQDGNTLINIKLLSNVAGFGFVLAEILKPFGFNYLQSSNIASSLKGISGRLFYSQTHVVNIDRDNLIISLKEKEVITLLIAKGANDYSIANKTISTKTALKETYSIKRSNSIMALDKGKLKFPLEVRNWKKGDVFYPLGMKGKKKLSDFMIDAKIPVNLKDKILVVVSDGEIAGILNHRLDDRFKITTKTQQVFEISIN